MVLMLLYNAHLVFAGPHNHRILNAKRICSDFVRKTAGHITNYLSHIRQKFPTASDNAL